MMILYQLLVRVICWAVRIIVVKCKCLSSHAHSRLLSWNCAGKTKETIKIKCAKVSIQMHNQDILQRSLIYKYITTCPDQLLFKYFYLHSLNSQWQLPFNHIHFNLQLRMFITEVVAVCDICRIKVWHVKEPSSECWRSIIIVYDKQKVYLLSKINQKGVRYTYKSLFRKMNCLHTLFLTCSR